jgi:GNAT superfamily N-acetyltransferase
MQITLLNPSDLQNILSLLCQLNPKQTPQELEQKILDMLAYANYRCFGLWEEQQLVALSGGWITTRLYSGKQLEIDNIVVDQNCRSKGYGEKLVEHIAEWSKQQGCITLELNTYVTNSRSHKFYFNQGMEIIGFRFQKYLIK